MADNLPSLADLLQGRGASAFAQPGLAPFSVAPQFAAAGQGMNNLTNVGLAPPQRQPYGPDMVAVDRLASLADWYRQFGGNQYAPGDRESTNFEDHRGQTMRHAEPVMPRQPWPTGSPYDELGPMYGTSY